MNFAQNVMLSISIYAVTDSNEQVEPKQTKPCSR